MEYKTTVAHSFHAIICVMDDLYFRQVSGNIRRFSDDLAGCAISYGREPESVKLMAVTKTHPWQAIEAASAAGVNFIGENRVQEVVSKFPVKWPFPETKAHLIGHLQKNKVKKILPYITCIQSIDDAETLVLVDKEANVLGRKIDVFLEVNTGGEDAKHGVRGWDALAHLAEVAVTLDWVRVQGLMTVGPLTESKMQVSSAFRACVQLAERVRREFSLATCSELSMGMSSDWKIAVAEGSTMVRVGTALFGTRT